jgi:ATP-dependent DNA helicase RecQ
MGFDKPDLAFVVHFQSPGSPIAYYQQVGRAGRALESAQGILLRGREDVDIQDYFIRSAFPRREQAEAVVDLLAERGEPLSIGDIEAVVNVRHSRIETMLKVLDVEGAVEHVEGGWRRTLLPWTYPAERVENVTAQRRAEQAAMHSYAATEGCRMAFLLDLLDDIATAACGRCDRCTGRVFDPVVPTELVAEAGAFLRGAQLAIEPRKQWLWGPSRSSIPPDRRAGTGRALSVYGDGGWGSVVRQAKYHDHAYADSLVDATVRVLETWQPSPPPAWVTSVPSTSSGPLIAGFARQVASRLGLPYREVLRRSRPGRPQKEMENSVQQLRNVYGAFDVTEQFPDTPVLVIDDIVDSGWTLTVVAAALREGGAAAVHPLVLAKAVSG